MYVALIFLGGNVVRRYCTLLMENTDRQDIGVNPACRSYNKPVNPHRKRVLRVSKIVRRQISQNSACRSVSDASRCLWMSFLSHSLQRLCRLRLNEMSGEIFLKMSPLLPTWQVWTDISLLFLSPTTPLKWLARFILKVSRKSGPTIQIRHTLTKNYPIYPRGVCT